MALSWEAWAADPRSTDELFETAREEEADPDTRVPGVSALLALLYRPTVEVVERAVELLDSYDSDERCLGVSVLAELTETEHGRDPAFVEETVVALLDRSEIETDDEVLALIARAFGYRRDPRPLPTLLGWLDYPDQPVRFSVACSLPACATPSTAAEAADALIYLTRDENQHVRDYALFGLPALELDTPAIRDATLARTNDPYPEAAGQALYNLAGLRDLRVIAPLTAHIAAGHGDYWGFEAAALLADPTLLPALLAAPAGDPGYEGDREAAIAACRGLRRRS